MSLEKSYLRAIVETKEQLEACLLSPVVKLIYIDSEIVKASELSVLCDRCHRASKYIGLRLPHIWRTEAEIYFTEAASEIKNAGFDAFLFRNFEAYAFFKANNLLNEAEVVLDSNVYAFNSVSEEFINELMDGRTCTLTLSEELNKSELKMLNRELKSETELKVYGYTSMMVTAQCIRKTTRGCDKCPSLMYLKDRKGAMLPVKNHCTWCYNTILNSVPTVLYDMESDIAAIAPDHIRYDFTIESGREVKAILDSQIYIPKDFTRGHFKRGVE